MDIIRTMSFFQKIQLNSKIKTCLKGIIAIALLTWLFYTIDIDSMKSKILATDFRFFFISYLIVVFRSIFGALRWQVLLTSRGYKMPLGALTSYYFIGGFLNFFCPTVVGGDIGRGFYLYRRGVVKEVAIDSIITERILGVAALICFSLFSILINTSLVDVPGLKYMIIAVSICFFSFIILIFHQGTWVLIPKKIKTYASNRLGLFVNLWHGIRKYTNSPGVLFKCFLITILFQLSGITATYLIGISIGCTTTFYYYLMLLPIVWLISMIPITLNGLGLRESAFVFLFVSVGMNKEAAVSISILVFLLAVGQGLLGSIFFIFNKVDIKSIQRSSLSDGK